MVSSSNYITLDKDKNYIIIIKYIIIKYICAYVIIIKYRKKRYLF